MRKLVLGEARFAMGERGKGNPTLTLARRLSSKSGEGTWSRFALIADESTHLMSKLV